MKISSLLAAGVVCVSAGAALANDIHVNASGLPLSSAAPYGHVFMHDVGAFTDTIDFVVPVDGLHTSANPLNVQVAGSDVFNISNLRYDLWGGTSGSSSTWYGTFNGNTTSYTIGTMAGAFHILVTGNADGTSGGVYGIGLISAVREPETYGMVLLGLGLLGFAARRQQKSPKF